MKLFTTIKNERGGKKSTADDTRILIELSYKNKMLGTLGLYTIQNHPDGSDLGYRVMWSAEGDPYSGQMLLEEEKTGKKLQGECRQVRGGGIKCTKEATKGDFCDDHASEIPF